jgi:hypothetical protein
MRRYIFVTMLVTSLTGCNSNVQTTSGESYLSQYKNVLIQDSGRTATSTEIKSIDQRVREAAAVEPILKFPARIGLARVSKNGLSNVPAEEAEAWNIIREKLGAEFGEFIPINPLVAKMVAGNDRTENVIDTIRLAAARQHLDAVLVYEVFSKESKSDNILKVANLSIVGGYVMPSEHHEVEGFADALLIDVVQGYPYGTIQTTVEKESRESSSWGWGSSYDEQQKFSDAIKTKAVKQLSDETYDLFIKLRTELADKQHKS